MLSFKNKHKTLLINLLQTILKKRIAVNLFLLLSVSSRVFSQFDSQLSQYMHNLSLVNPAYAGEQTMIQTSLFQRTQWIGMPGAPIVSSFLIDSPLKLFNEQHGVGIHFLSDIFGVFNNQQVRLMYAYKRNLGRGHISIGANLGFLNIICNGDSINISKISQDDGYHTANDPIIPLGKQTGIGADLGLGVQYFDKDYRVGISLTHINAPTIKLRDVSSFKTAPLLQAHVGYDFKMNNEDYNIRTNILCTSDFTSLTSHISALLYIKEKIWVGLGYRLEDSFCIIGGIKLFEGMKIGYSFDLPTSKLIYKTFGSHEIFATYEFSFFRDKSKAIKSIRIL